jgi:hypothetical protein
LGERRANRKYHRGNISMFKLAIFKMLGFIVENPKLGVISLGKMILRNFRVLALGYVILLVIMFIIEFLLTFTLNSMGVRQMDFLSLSVHGVLLVLGEFLFLRFLARLVVEHFGSSRSARGVPEQQIASFEKRDTRGGEHCVL